MNTDIVAVVAKELERNRYTYIGIAIGLIIPIFVLSGCLEAKVDSSVTKTRSTSDQVYLVAEAKLAEYAKQIAHIEADMESIAQRANIEIQQADAITEQRYAIVRSVGESLATNPLIAGTGFGAVLASVLGNIGQFADRRRKDKKIVELKKKLPAETA